MGILRDIGPDADAGTHPEPIIAESITQPPVTLPPEDAPIDIRIDDNGTLPPDDAPVHLPAYSPHTALGAPIADRPPIERKLTPVGSYPIHLPGALWESGIMLNPNLSLLDVWVEQDPQPDDAPPAPPTSSSPVVAAAGSSTSEAAAAAPPPIAPAPPVDDFFAAKPHPDAMFVPETLEWRLVVEEAKLSKRPNPDDSIFTIDALFEACNLRPRSVRVYETVPTTLPAAVQLYPVRSGGGSNAGAVGGEVVVEDFNSHKCWITGHRLLSSPPDTITTVIDRRILIRFRENRRSEPAVGMSPQETFVRALRVLVRVVGNAAHGDTRSIVTHGATMRQKLIYDDIVRDIFEQLGWTTAVIPTDGRETVRPTGPADGPEASRRLLRAWMELQLWLAYETELLKAENPASSILSQPNPAGAIITSVMTRDAKLRLKELIDYRSDQVSSRDELVKFAYLIKLETDANQAELLLTCVEAIQTGQRQDSQVLGELLAYEKSRGRFTTHDLDKAYGQLQLSERDLGGAVSRNKIPHDFILDSYRARLRDAAARGDASDYHGAKEALKVISQSLGSPDMLAHACNAMFEMELDQASTLLEVGQDFDDVTVLAIYDIRVGDAPGKTEMLRDALFSIAESRKSEYLRSFLRTGKKPEETQAHDAWQQMPSADRPAGINNIGNTCYLNSVLQYFFTIREIRERVFQLAAATSGTGQQHGHDPAAALDSVSRSRRVGGRKVSAREVERSMRFVTHLAELFHQLIHTPDLAVTPKRELAYLALVSSRVEEDEAVAGGAAATPKVGPSQTILSEEPTSISPVQEKSLLPEPSEGEGATAASVDQAESMDQSETQITAPPTGTGPVDGDPAGEANAADAADVPLPPSRSVTMDVSSSPPAADPASIALPPSRAATVAVPPPLPRRPKRADTPAAPMIASSSDAAVPPPARQNSLMQFGAQQDVSECLDNCLFQLEIALAAQNNAVDESQGGAELPADTGRMDVDDNSAPLFEEASADEDLLSKLFLGKTCQQLELVEPDAAKGPSIHTKKEVFKILPVDVLEEGRDLYDGLDGFFDEETLIGSEGKPVRRTVTLLEPPPLLQIQLQRVQYDRQTMRAFKSQAHLEMYETLYMDRYLDFDPADPEDQVRLDKRRRSREARRKIAALRARMAELRPNGKPAMSQSLLNTEQVLKDLAQIAPLEDGAGAGSSQMDTSSASGGGTPDIRGATDAADQDATTTPAPPSEPLSSLITPDLLSFLHAESDSVVSEISSSERAISALKEEMTSIWTDEKRAEYSLAAVFMHRGEASHGHYFLNQRCLSSSSSSAAAAAAAGQQQQGGEGKWFKYNDNVVSVAEAKDVLRDTTGATPYLVTYGMQLDSLIDPSLDSSASASASASAAVAVAAQEEGRPPSTGTGMDVS
ncbi:related to UBP2 - ubiquitin-specific proteinase [Pseudozyma flocculosa]|uniref:ubiquitinyl hydrolase 1 n=1 Tax=Pseudozyma flocculosa TaxID=84751 RepID=A0A5C3EUN2_9BASI|nr:related to UBP2 - ubiquitin-specific proteinase [Pseudozyma flocculosa]